jgi:BirA family transcriptional regulator, biotin operon repressor / biotin---[acetyl-CoA-carboxylase] ligase
MIFEEFHTAAAGFPDPYRLLIRESVDSTNDEVRQLAQLGAADGLIILAHQQTQGRGRRGAAWFSPSGESLAFSILLRPSEPKFLWSRFALAAGLAVAEAIESFGLEAGIKWPNDVWLSNRKVAGILVETGADFAVLGIGINVNITEFPEDVSEIATSLQLAGRRCFSRAEVLAQVIHHFSRRRYQIEMEYAEVIREIETRCVLSGKRVSLLASGVVKSGRVTGIAATGELLLETDLGIERLTQADEVRRLDSRNSA